MAVALLHGFVLIVTQAADPHQLTPDTLMDTFASPLTLVGWAQLYAVLNRRWAGRLRDPKVSSGGSSARKARDYAGQLRCKSP